MDLFVKDNKVIKVMGNREYGQPNEGNQHQARFLVPGQGHDEFNPRRRAVHIAVAIHGADLKAVRAGVQSGKRG